MLPVTTPCTIDGSFTNVRSERISLGADARIGITGIKSWERFESRVERRYGSVTVGDGRRRRRDGGAVQYDGRESRCVRLSRSVHLDVQSLIA